MSKHWLGFHGAWVGIGYSWTAQVYWKSLGRSPNTWNTALLQSWHLNKSKYSLEPWERSCPKERAARLEKKGERETWFHWQKVQWRRREQEVGRFLRAIDSSKEADSRSVTLHHKKFLADGGSDSDGNVSYYYALVKVHHLLRTYMNIIHEKII